MGVSSRAQGNDEEASICTACAPGYWSDQRATNCEMCEAGTYADTWPYHVKFMHTVNFGDATVEMRFLILASPRTIFNLQANICRASGVPRLLQLYQV